MIKNYDIIETYYDHNLFVVTIRMLKNSDGILVAVKIEDEKNATISYKSESRQGLFVKDSDYSFYFWVYDHDYYHKTVYKTESEEHDECSSVVALTEEDYEMHNEYLRDMRNKKNQIDM
jgi:hypothetical protein